jgi:F0F1-type ATP synthase delta subunit
VPLTAAQVAKFEEETGKLLSKNVELVNETDHALIGGVSIFIDGKHIDASIRRRLDDLREQIS